MEHGTNGRAPGRVLEAGDIELFEHIENNLYTAVLADSLDEIGLRQQAMRETIRPLSPDVVFAGWARTIVCVDVYHNSEDPYRVEIEAVDSLMPGEVAVVATAQILDPKQMPRPSIGDRGRNGLLHDSDREDVFCS